MPLAGQDSRPDALMGSGCGLLEDPAGYSLCMVPCMGNPVLVNLFSLHSALALSGPPHRLLLLIPPHCTAGPLGWSPTRLRMLYCPFQSSSGGEGCSAAASLSNFLFLCLVRSRGRSVSPLVKQTANRWMRWQFHLILMESLRVFTVLVLGRRKFVGKEGTGITLGNRTCRPLRTPRPSSLSSPFDFIDLWVKSWSVGWPYSAVLQFLPGPP